jgi:hypothetical protein
MSLVFIDKVNENRTAFANKVVSIANDLDIDPNWLMLVMNSESGLNHKARNTSFPVQGGYATGLIQFVPDTAKGLGTSTEALYNMSNLEQLDWVKKYFYPYRDKIQSFSDLYMVTFFPAAVGKPANWILQAKNLSALAVARWNPIFDLNKDGKITVAEAEEAFLKRVPEYLRNELRAKSINIYKKIRLYKWHIITILILLVLIYFYFKNGNRNKLG